jgi:hypothetical protein
VRGSHESVINYTCNHEDAGTKNFECPVVCAAVLSLLTMTSGGQ